MFDGISCGRLALERAGFNTTSYEAYEIEPHAIDRYRYEMIGTGWTVDVVAHIFGGIA